MSGNRVIIRNNGSLLSINNNLDILDVYFSLINNESIAIPVGNFENDSANLLDNVRIQNRKQKLESRQFQSGSIN